VVELIQAQKLIPFSFIFRLIDSIKPEKAKLAGERDCQCEIKKKIDMLEQRFKDFASNSAGISILQEQRVYNLTQEVVSLEEELSEEREQADRDRERAQEALLAEKKRGEDLK